LATKLIIDVDPGIGDALAVALALIDPDLDVLAVTATAGSVSGPVATRNLQAVVEQVDPAKWPRLGAAPVSPAPAEISVAGDAAHLDFLNGPTGLGDYPFEVAVLHHQRDSARLMIDLVRNHPREITLLTLGPLTNIEAACERAPEFLSLLGGFVVLGGAVADGGDATAAAEFNIFCDPEAAQNVFKAPGSKTLIPLDATSKVVLTFEDFSRCASEESRVDRFLSRILPYTFRAHHQYLGVEGMRLREVAALAAVSRPELFRFQSMSVDIETRGDLTRGMTVFDRRTFIGHEENVSVAVEVDHRGIVEYVARLLRQQTV